MDEQQQPRAAATAPLIMGMAETAAVMAKTEKQLRWMVYKDTAPPSALIGGRRMFRRIDVEQWINDQFDAARDAG